MGRAAGIALTILGFLLWWPVGLATLFYFIGSGRMGCWGRRNRAAQRDNTSQQDQVAPWNAVRDWALGTGRPLASTPSSGNRAFDDYRAETLRRLEEEQNEFGAFLDRLRFAKDKSEFDAFMAERRKSSPPVHPEEPNRA
jgi:hypothetical protein